MSGYVCMYNLFVWIANNPTLFDSNWQSYFWLVIVALVVAVSCRKCLLSPFAVAISVAIAIATATGIIFLQVWDLSKRWLLSVLCQFQIGLNGALLYLTKTILLIRANIFVCFEVYYAEIFGEILWNLLCGWIYFMMPKHL